MQVFISYKSEYRDFARQVQARLREWGYATWFDLDDIPKGTYFRHAIQEGLDRSDVMVGVMTQEAFTSREVMAEWDYFLAQEKELLPLKYRECKPLYHLIAIQWIDFLTGEDQGFSALRERLTEIRSDEGTAREEAEPPAPDFDKMTPEELMQWMETLAQRQGSTTGTTTSADFDLERPEPSSPAPAAPGGLGGMPARPPSAAAPIPPPPQPLAKRRRAPIWLGTIAAALLVGVFGLLALLQPMATMPPLASSTQVAAAPTLQSGSQQSTVLPPSAGDEPTPTWTAGPPLQQVSRPDQSPLLLIAVTVGALALLGVLVALRLRPRRDPLAERLDSLELNEVELGAPSRPPQAQKPQHQIDREGAMAGRDLRRVALDHLRQEWAGAAEPTPPLLLRHLDYGDAPPPDGAPLALIGDVNGELLLLGEPGAARRTLLRQFGRALLAHAAQDSAAPLPVRFDLAAWALVDQTLEQWLAEEFNSRFRLNSGLLPVWLGQDGLLPMFEALDALSPDRQNEFLDELNEMRRRYPKADWVLVALPADYARLTAALDVRSALVVQAAPEPI